MQCSQCKEFGHTKVRCKQLPVEDDVGGGDEQNVHATGAPDSGETDAWGAGEASGGGW